MNGVCVEFVLKGGRLVFSSVWCAVPRVGDQVNIPVYDEAEEELGPSELFQVTGVGWGQWGAAPNCAAMLEVEKVQE